MRERHGGKWSQACEEEPKILKHRKQQHLRRSCGDAGADDGLETSDVREYVKEAMAGLALVLTMGETPYQAPSEMDTDVLLTSVYAGGPAS